MPSPVLVSGIFSVEAFHTRLPLASVSKVRLFTGAVIVGEFSDEIKDSTPSTNVGSLLIANFTCSL